MEMEKEKWRMENEKGKKIIRPRCENPSVGRSTRWRKGEGKTGCTEEGQFQPSRDRPRRFCTGFSIGKLVELPGHVATQADGHQTVVLVRLPWYRLSRNLVSGRASPG